MPRRACARDPVLAAALVALATAAAWVVGRVLATSPDDRAGIYVVGLVAVGVALIPAILAAVGLPDGAAAVLLLAVGALVGLSWLVLYASWTRPAPYLQPGSVRLVSFAAANGSAIASAAVTVTSMRRTTAWTSVLAIAALPVVAVSLMLMIDDWSNTSD